jgi:hypothetical protein
MKTKYERDAFKRRAAYAVHGGKLYRFARRYDRDEFVRDNLWDDVRPLTGFQAFVLRLLARLGIWPHFLLCRLACPPLVVSFVSGPAAGSWDREYCLAGKFCAFCAINQCLILR